jgi:hypothetical protein
MGCENTVSTTETSLAGVPTAFPTKRGRGRRPVVDSNARECKDRITSWKLTPEEKRQPPTLTALATELGISKQMASYYAQQVPQSIEELVDNAEREALGSYPGVLKTLGELARKGSVEAIKVFIRELAGPRRPEQKPPSTIGNIHLQQTIQMLLHPGQSTSPAVKNGPTEASTRQIPSKSEANEESTC